MSEDERITDDYLSAKIMTINCAFPTGTLYPIPFVATILNDDCSGPCNVSVAVL